MRRLLCSACALAFQISASFCAIASFVAASFCDCAAFSFITFSSLCRNATRFWDICLSFATAFCRYAARSFGSSVWFALRLSTAISYCVFASCFVRFLPSLVSCWRSLSRFTFFCSSSFTFLNALPTRGRRSISREAPIARLSKPSTAFSTHPAIVCSTSTTPVSTLWNGARIRISVFVFSSDVLMPFASAMNAAVIAAIVATIGLASNARSCLPKPATADPACATPALKPP